MWLPLTRWWRWTAGRRRALIAGGLLLLLVALGFAPKDLFRPLARDPLAEGRQLYVANCAGCHGETGDRVAYVPLNRADYLATLGDPYLVRVVSKGKDTMPAFLREYDGALTSEEIELIVRYVRSSQGPAGDAASLEAAKALAGFGRSLYLENCADCHGLDGAKLEQAKIGSERYVNSRGESSLKRIILTGQASMPPFASTLDEDKVKAIIAYMRTLRVVGDDLTVAEPAAGAPVRQPGVAPGVPHSLADRGDSCVVCHGPTGMRPFSSNHAGRTNETCMLCHQGTVGALVQPVNVPRVPHGVAGREQCLTCHGPQALRAVPADHSGRTNDQCSQCHRPPQQASAGAIPRIPHGIQGREACLGCHTTGFLKPVPANHAGRTEDGCASCHQPGPTEPGRPVPGIEHDVKGAADCLRCHGGARRS